MLYLCPRNAMIKSVVQLISPILIQYARIQPKEQRFHLSKAVKTGLDIFTPFLGYTYVSNGADHMFYYLPVRGPLTVKKPAKVTQDRNKIRAVKKIRIA